MPKIWRNKMKKIFVLIVLLTLVMAVPVAAGKYTFYMTFEWAASEDPSCFAPTADKVMAISYEDAVDFTKKLMNHYRSGGHLIRNVRVVGQEPDRSIYAAVGYLETEKYKLLKRENPPAPELQDFTKTIRENIELYRQDRLRKEEMARIEAAEKKAVETEKRYCAHVRAEFDNSVIQVDIWAYSDNQARCMIEAVMESFPAGDGGYDLFYGSCIDPSGDKIYIDNYPSCKEL
jgi:hypothetical protein